MNELKFLVGEQKRGSILWWLNYWWIELMNCLCGMVQRRKAFSRVSSRYHCQRSPPSQIFDTPQAGFESAQNLSSGLVEWSCVVVITTILRCQIVLKSIKSIQLPCYCVVLTGFSSDYLSSWEEPIWLNEWLVLSHCFIILKSWSVQTLSALSLCIISRIIV